MRQALKFAVALALAIGSIAAGIGVAQASSGDSEAGGLGCCRIAI